MAKTKAKKTVKKTPQKKHDTMFSAEDFTRANFVQGGLVRPGLLLLAFSTFVAAMFLLLLGAQGSLEALKWGGSLIIFSFVINLYGIYLTLMDKPSFFRSMNLGFKLVMFIGEIIAFNWVLIYV